MLLIFLGLLV